MFDRTRNGAGVRGYSCGDACNPQMTSQPVTTAGIDSTPAPQASAPSGQTANTLAAAGSFAVSFTPYCNMTVDTIFFDAAPAALMTITAVEVAGRNYLGGAGGVPGSLFSQIANGGNSAVPLVETPNATHQQPLIVRGTLSAAGTITGAVIGKKCG